MKFKIIPLSLSLAICRLDSDQLIPNWAINSDFFSITKTADELSIVCNQSSVPDDIQHEKDWRCFKVVGPIHFSVVGVLADISDTLSTAQISIFAISTFDTDYILVKNENFESAKSLICL